jgi:soluble lytic murein transglycosylase-like protein
VARLAAHLSNRSLTSERREPILALRYDGLRADSPCVRRNNRLLALVVLGAATVVTIAGCGSGSASKSSASTPRTALTIPAPQASRPTPVEVAGGGRFVPPSAGGGRTAPLAQDLPISLPVASPWSLPPLILVHARLGGGSRARLGAQVLQSRHLALSPVARTAVRKQRVDPGLLRLLLRARPTGTPMLVFAAAGQDARLQQTTLWMTRRVLRGFHELPAASRPQRMLLTPVPGERADLAGPPKPKPGTLPTLVTLYRAAGYRYGIDWRILAAINRVETGYGSNLSTSSAGAVGWMQFLPGTWRAYGVDASGDGVADPMNPADAIYSAARYLEANGIHQDVRRAIWHYNPLTSYVNMVLSIAARLPEHYGETPRSSG